MTLLLPIKPTNTDSSGSFNKIITVLIIFLLWSPPLFAQTLHLDEAVQVLSTSIDKTLKKKVKTGRFSSSMSLIIKDILVNGKQIKLSKMIENSLHDYFVNESDFDVLDRNYSDRTSKENKKELTEFQYDNINGPKVGQFAVADVFITGTITIHDRYNKVEVYIRAIKKDRQGILASSTVNIYLHEVEEYLVAISQTQLPADKRLQVEKERQVERKRKAEEKRLANLKAERERQRRITLARQKKQQRQADRKRKAEEKRLANLKAKKERQRQTTGMEFVSIPAGNFKIGDIQGGGDSTEKPVHWVNIKTFYMSKTEITQGQWQAVMNNNPSRFKKGNQYPVEQVSWNDIQAYIKKLNKLSGKTHRLPSEAQWEYAARANSTSKYSWGNSIGHNHANCDGCGSQWDNKQTAPVASFSPNAFGLHDMHGNVWEWTQDCWDDYSNFFLITIGVPTDDSAWESGDCAKRVLRGGSWNSIPRGLRSATRNRITTSNSRNNTGFRLIY